MNFFIRIVFIFNTFTMLTPVHASEIQASYRANLDVRQLSNRQYPLDFEATITNHSDQTLDHLVWLVYPNRFNTILPNINDVNLHRVYPYGFSFGQLEIESVDAQKYILEDVQWSPLSVDQLDNIFFRQQLPKPLAPGETRVISIKAVLHMPEKLGSYGYYDNLLTVSGGWTPTLVSFQDGQFHPTAQAPEANWDVTFTHDDQHHIILPEALISDHSKPITLKSRRQFAFQIGDVHRFAYQQGQHQFEFFHQERKANAYNAMLAHVADNFSAYMQKHFPQAPSSHALAQAPLREMLVVDATPISFFSDRTFKVVSAITHFHEIPLYKSLFIQAFGPSISERESDADTFWVQEVIAWRYTEDLVASLRNAQRDVRDIGIIRTFKFLPLIDRVLYTPQFAFYDVFYNLVYPVDTVRDEYRRFSPDQPFGQTIFAYMEDEFGKDTIRIWLDEFMQSQTDLSLVQWLSNKTGENLTDRFAQWTSARPAMNYKLGKHHKKKIRPTRIEKKQSREDGTQSENTYAHSVTVEKEFRDPTASLLEPVELKVSYKNKPDETLIWKSRENTHTYTFESDQPIKAIEVDPRERLKEWRNDDNRRPTYWKFVMLGMFVDYDIDAGEPLFQVQTQIRKRYGGLNRFNLGGYYLLDAYGANVGFTHLFGKAIDALRLSHGMNMSFRVNRLQEDTSIVNTLPSPTEVVSTPSGFANDFAFSYVFGNQLSYINPLKGGYGNVTFRVGNKALGSQFNYQSLEVGGARIFQITPNHLYGLRLRLSAGGGQEMPSQIQFRLGGLTAMKGLPLTDDRFAGKNMLLLSQEYRHFLAQDMDLNLWLFRMRRIQGALFSNAGHVTETVQERANIQAGLASTRSNFSDLFDVSDWQFDVGYGVRCQIHYFGVSPSLLSFDIARSINLWDDGWRFYIGVNQSF